MLGGWRWQRQWRRRGKTVLVRWGGGRGRGRAGCCGVCIASAATLPFLAQRRPSPTAGGRQWSWQPPRVRRRAGPASAHGRPAARRAAARHPPPCPRGGGPAPCGPVGGLASPATAGREVAVGGEQFSSVASAAAPSQSARPPRRLKSGASHIPLLSPPPCLPTLRAVTVAVTVGA